MKGVFSSGEKDKKLNRKNLEWYCDRLLGYAHEGRPLDCFLRDHYIRKSVWDKYVKKHKDLQTALKDAEERHKGAIQERLISSANTTALTNPTLLKTYAEQLLGWTKSSGHGSSDGPPPVINFIRADPLPHQLPGGKVPHLHVQETGELVPKKGNGKSNGGNGSG